jgi:hypothetical protein
VEAFLFVTDSPNKSAKNREKKLKIALEKLALSEIVIIFIAKGGNEEPFRKKGGKMNTFNN